jgi:ParB-like chromosome segregation protein Spo0J
MAKKSTDGERGARGQGGLQIVRLRVAELSNDPANARKHDDRNIGAIVASLRRFGQQKPIVVDSSNVVRAGNGTLEAARSLGWEMIDAVVTDLKGTEAIAYAVADNRTAELAEWDDDVLAATLEGLQLEGMLDDVGFTDDELAALMPDFEPGTEDDQGQLDQLEPKIVTCPNCKTEFDCREQV